MRRKKFTVYLVLPYPSRPLRGPRASLSRILPRGSGFAEVADFALSLGVVLVAIHKEVAVGDEVVISHYEVLLGNAPALAVGEDIALRV